ncbi:MAG: ATP-dependent DNA helicase RecG [Bacilli bacterium]|nr:ATP-dependent DNA helicase RecG [Bacilli bacterium]
MKQLEEIKGLGPKTKNTLQRLGIVTSEDLLFYYPFRYDILKKSNIEELKQDDKIVIDGLIESVPSVFHINRRLDKMNFRFAIEGKLLQVVIFNRAFLKSKLSVGTTVTVIGKYDPKHNTIVANDIYLMPLPKTPRIDPVYHSYGGIGGKQIRSYLEQIFKEDICITDYIPEGIREKYQFMDKERSLKQIHFPTNTNSLKSALLRAKYEELFLFMLKMNYLKQEKTHDCGLKRELSFQKIEMFINKLPFTLTDDQFNCVKEIYKDLKEPRRMNRLVQGDVGSGKTIVSFIAMYMNHLSGYQSALMAPTEILARQHYKKLVEIFETYEINVAILTGKTKAKEKKEIYEGLRKGTISIVVGTHALISDGVEYQNLGLVITDEQHRFGVNQRSNLKNKGTTPDILYMSATPIPRTYALTIYGDMDVSNIHTMPNGRLPIITTLKKNSEIRDVLESMYQELKKGHQVYVIAPLIEESEKIDLENVTLLEEKMKKAFGRFYQIGVLHGKMTPKEKEEVMLNFEQNKIQILISTTVVEVGVDVPNATMIVIFDSERFGLSALHQLRGRVGRNDLQSYCILISDIEKERLSILTKTTDGFKISEEDFKLRGSGDLFGVRQSGDMQFQIADLKKDFSILMRAKEDSEAYISNGKIEGNEILKGYIEQIKILS